jgi:hypothetical protein
MYSSLPKKYKKMFAELTISSADFVYNLTLLNAQKLEIVQPWKIS